MANYKVVTLCGSTRFKDEFMKAQKELTLKGYIVISVGLFGHSGDSEVWENMDEGTLTKTKEMLDDMHKRKIDMADEIFVVNILSWGFLSAFRKHSQSVCCLCFLVFRETNSCNEKMYFIYLVCFLSAFWKKLFSVVIFLR